MARRVPQAVAFREFDGLQILWGDGDEGWWELECIPRDILERNFAKLPADVTTGAVCTASSLPNSYRYVARASFGRGTLKLTYDRPPKAWSEDQADELIKGTTTIWFREGTRQPSKIRWHAKGERAVTLEARDWAYAALTARTPTFGDREKLPRTVTDRPKQSWLRATLLATRAGCQLSEVNTEGALEACHIISVGNRGTEEPMNALLMRRDLHALFDRQKLRLLERADKMWHVWVAADVRREPLYRDLHEKVVPGLTAHAPWLRARMKLEEKNKHAE